MPMSKSSSDTHGLLYGQERYCEDCRRDTYGGFTRAELSEAFDRIKPLENWKQPIHHVFAESLTQREIAMTDAAIEFYTGSRAVFSFLADHWEVSARGYYQSVGA